MMLGSSCRGGSPSAAAVNLFVVCFGASSVLQLLYFRAALSSPQLNVTLPGSAFPAPPGRSPKVYFLLRQK